jgi:hypothetical protein
VSGADYGEAPWSYRGVSVERREATMGRARIGLAEVLAAAEDAAPVGSLDAVSRNLRDRFGARGVSFLLADLVGRQVVRINGETGKRPGAGSNGSTCWVACMTRCCALRRSCGRRAAAMGSGCWRP